MITSVGTGKHLQNRLCEFKKKRSKEAYSQLAGEREKDKEGKAGGIGGSRGRGNYFFSVIEVK